MLYSHDIETHGIVYSVSCFASPNALHVSQKAKWWFCVKGWRKTSNWISLAFDNNSSLLSFILFQFLSKTWFVYCTTNGYRETVCRDFEKFKVLHIVLSPNLVDWVPCSLRIGQPYSQIKYGWPSQAVHKRSRLWRQAVELDYNSEE